MKTVRMDIAGHDIESLTCCQANRIRVGMKTVRRDTAEPDIESLTCCQANRIKFEVRSSKQ